MSSFTLWIRLKECDVVDKCIKHLGELFNADKSYKVFPSHLTLVPSISSKHPNLEAEEIMEMVKETVENVKEQLGRGNIIYKNISNFILMLK